METMKNRKIEREEHYEKKSERESYSIKQEIKQALWRSGLQSPLKDLELNSPSHSKHTHTRTHTCCGYAVHCCA